METVSAVPSIVKDALRVLAEKPSALITDIDGTISRIVPRPEDAVVSERARDSLRRLSRLVSFVAIVTGRQETVARRMVGVEDLTYVGNYALDAATSMLLSEASVAQAKETIRPLLQPFPCVTLEEKGISFTLHYRNCDEPEIRDRLLEVIRPITETAGVRVLEGKQVIEIAPADLPHKGVAIARLLRDNGVRGVVYLGDDLSDWPVFAEVRRRRAEEGLPGLGIVVVDEETGDAIREAGDVQLRSVDEAEEFLSQLARYLGKEGAP